MIMRAEEIPKDRDLFMIEYNNHKLCEVINIAKLAGSKLTESPCVLTAEDT